MFNNLPIILLILLNFLILYLSLATGFFLGKRYLKKRQEADKTIGSIVTAQIGIVAFMIAFIFGMTSSRFEMRRASLIEEANSIGTTYLRTDLLPDPQRSELKHLLREYVSKYMEVHRDPSLLEKNVEEAGSLIDSCWKIGSGFLYENPGQEAASIFIQSLNQTIDLYSKRVTVLIHLSLPESIWITLYSLSMLSMLISGFHFGISGLKLGIPAAVLVLTFSIMIAMIADLDGTKSGIFRTSSAPFMELEKKINSEVK